MYVCVCACVCVCVCVCPSTVQWLQSMCVLHHWCAYLPLFSFLAAVSWRWLKFMGIVNALAPLPRSACNLWSLCPSAVAITWKTRVNNPVFLDFRAYTRKVLYTVSSPDPSTFDMAIFMAVRAWPVWKLQANSLCVWQVADPGRSDLPEKC